MGRCATQKFPGSTLKIPKIAGNSQKTLNPKDTGIDFENPKNSQEFQKKLKITKVPSNDRCDVI